MKAIRILSTIISFILINILFLLVFMVSTFFIFGGEEKTGNLVTIITICFFVLSIIASISMTKRINLYLNKKGFKTNVTYFIVALLIFVSILQLVNLTSYVTHVE
jgi:hypothetical protein